MDITLSPEIEESLKAKFPAGDAAAFKAYVEDVVRIALASDADSTASWEWLGTPAPDIEGRAAAVREIEELSRNVRLGPDLSIRDLIEEGRL